MVKGYTSPTAASLGMRPLHEGIVSNQRESRSLAGLRDALLLKLLSDEICVGNDTRSVGET
jgi:hypothetical protein